MLDLHCWSVIALAIAAGVWRSIIGTRQPGLAILKHEAAHGAPAKTLKLNDFLGHWLCAVPTASLNAPDDLSVSRQAASGRTAEIA